MAFDYNLRVGSVVLGLEFSREEERDAFAGYFGRASCGEGRDILLKLSFSYEAPIPDSIPDSLFLTKICDGRGFSAGGGLVSGSYSPASGEGELRVEAAIMEGGFVRVFEQILYQAYYSASRRRNQESFLLHCCGAIRGDRAYAFVGKSGSGKSTIAALCAEAGAASVLNDEICVLEPGPGRTRLLDSPFNGFFRGKVEGQAPLAGAMLLRQAPFHRLSPTRSAESLKILSREIVPPIGLENPLSSSSYWDMLGYAQKLGDSVPLYVMDFLPDLEFWPEIESRSEVAL